MEIRAYRHEDEAAALALAARLTEGMAPWRDVEAARLSVAGWVRDSIAAASQDGHAVFVAEVDHDVVGLVTVATRSHFTGATDAYVRELTVAPLSSGSGVGTALMHTAEAWARARGLRRLVLETGAGNMVARRFYARLGYVEEEVVLSKGL